MTAPPVPRAIGRAACAALLAAAGVFGVATPARAVQDELQVYDDDTAPKGGFEFELIGVWVPSARPLDADPRLESVSRRLQLSPNLGYGLTRDLTLGGQLFASMDTSGRSKLDGGRLELTWIALRPHDDDGDGCFAGGLLEVGRLPRSMSTARLNAELKGIAGCREGAWSFAANPTLDKEVAGEGRDEPAELGLNLKVARRVAGPWKLGVEHFGEWGTLSRPGRRTDEQAQTTFVALDGKVKGWGVNAAVGRGWTSASERWTFKLILSVALNDD